MLRNITIDELIPRPLRNIDVKQIMDNLDMKVRELSLRKSEQYKTNFMRIFLLGTAVLFLASYNLTESAIPYENETPGTLFLK